MNTVESKSAVKNSVLRVMIAAVLIIIQVFDCETCDIFI